MDNWWKNSVVYQIYPRSFKDSNEDGVGDLGGVIEKLDYLQFLGIDAIWLSPVFQSPNDDNGYDISDYRSIMDEFGTMEDMDQLISEAAKRNIRIIMDMVFNHTSDEHKWFLEAKKSKDNPYRDYYIFKDNIDGNLPNNLGSLFSGSAWEYQKDTDSYYLHMFSKKQPDLNYANEKVRQEMIDILNFWIDKGVGGFRLDVIEMIGKIPEQGIISNGPKLHEYIHEMYEKAFSRKDLMTVGECWCADTEIGKLYSNPKREELSMIFQFEHMTLDEENGKGKWHLKTLCLMDLKKTLNKWQLAFEEDGWNSLFWNNHDLPRIVSRFGNDKEYRIESAKMLATLLHGMKGTPYIYQGEEIGMTNICLNTIEEYEDIETINMYREERILGVSEEELMKRIHEKSRDNARTPMQWSKEENAGFTKGTPWFSINENYDRINVENALADNNSIFYHYKRLIELRKQKEIFVKGNYIPLCEKHEEIFAYIRRYENEGMLVLCNFYGNTVEVDIWREILDSLKLQTRDNRNLKLQRILLSNYKDSVVNIEPIILRPYEAIMYEFVLD